MGSSRAILAALGLAASLHAVSDPLAASAQGLTRVSVASDGTQAGGPSFAPALSADGRFVGFASDASNLVAGDTNGVADIFVHDRVTGPRPG
jgi:hypothetical protein